MSTKPSEEGVLYYRCKLCGNVTEEPYRFNKHVPNVERALSLKANDPTSVHRCAPDKLGVHELIGGRDRTT